MRRRAIRAELIRRLQEYERYKQAAEDIDALPVWDGIFSGQGRGARQDQQPPAARCGTRELLSALSDVMQRAEMFSHHRVESETLSVRRE